MRFLVILIGAYIPSLTVAQESPEGHLIMSIFFGGGSYYVDEEQIQELYDFIESIPDATQYTITIHSHTDNIGGAEFNDWLSRMRSRSVMNLLQQKGFTRESMEVKDFGMFNPVYDNSTWEGKIRNRRVDVIFWPLVM